MLISFGLYTMRLVDALTHVVLASVLIICSIVVHEVDEFEVVSLTTLEIIRVMRRSDLDSSCTELHIDSDTISDDRDSTSVEWVDDVFAVEVGVPRIVGVDSDGGIS